MPILPSGEPSLLAVMPAVSAVLTQPLNGIEPYEQ